MLPPGMCLSVSQQSSFNCGLNGFPCQSCAPGYTCAAGACVQLPDAGPTSGAVGDPCTIDADCSAVPSIPGAPAFCKQRTVPGGVVYAGGYCTHRCTGASQCPGGLCAYFLGSLGELENVCLAGCGATSPCRPGYQCIDFGSTSSPAPACWVWPDGGFPPEADAGPGVSGAAAGPCTDDLACRPPDTGWCAVEQLPDGGSTGYTGGECSASCALAMSDAWCGTGGACVGYLGPTDARGPTVQWVCQQGCTTAASTCRTGYVCTPFPGSASGLCMPRCSNPGYSCRFFTCNPTTGLCQ